MINKIVWRPAAIIDLNQIANYILERNPKAASRVVADIRQAVERLRHFPQLGRADEIGNVRVLQVARRNYLLPYKIVDGDVQILGVFDERRERPENWE